MFAAALLFTASSGAAWGSVDPDAAWVFTAQERVTWQLRSADAQFRGSRTFRGSGFPVVCGAVARPRQAFARFIVVGERILIQGRVGEPEFTYTWHEFCR